MDGDKRFKAFLVALAAGSAAYGQNDIFPAFYRAIAGVVAATSAALLAYLLKPTADPGPPADPK